MKKLNKEKLKYNKKLLNKQENNFNNVHLNQLLVNLAIKLLIQDLDLEYPLYLRLNICKIIKVRLILGQKLINYQVK